MKDRNVCTFTGRMTKDPELKAVGGSEVVNFSIAVNNSWKNKNGDKIEKTVFVDFDAWNGTAKFISEYVKKGDLVLVDSEYRRDKTDDGYFHGFRVTSLQKLVWEASQKEPAKQTKKNKPKTDESEQDLPF